MELNGIVLKQQPKLCFSSSKQIQFCSASSVVMRRKRAITVTGFYDQGNLQYYCVNRCCCSSSSAIVRSEKEKKVLKKTKKKKKRMKLLKGLFRDLTEMNFGLKSDGSLLDQVKGNIIADATERLLEQLQKLRAEEKELKRKKKEEKTRLKAVQMQNRLIHYEISSSESSSASDNEEVVDMNSLKHAQSNHIDTQPIIDEAISQPTLELLQETITEEIRDVELMQSINLGNACDHSQNSLDKTSCSKKIEVCMGGKCKKSGATALLERFQSVVGIEGAVTGCKCMGKCKTGPNVRVLNGFGDESVRSPSNPLCTGVCMEDVDFIVANFLGENRTQLGFAT